MSFSQSLEFEYFSSKGVKIARKIRFFKYCEKQ